MKKLMLATLAVGSLSVATLPASAMPIVKADAMLKDNSSITLVHGGHGHHYGWGTGHGHHRGWWHGRHRGWYH